MRYIHNRMENTAENHTPEHTYTFEGPCIQCKDNQKIVVKGQELFFFNQTGRISEFVSSTPADREMLLSGICDKCWREMFGEDES